MTSATGNAPSPGWSWASIILPFMEQGNLYTTIGVDPTGATGPPGASATNSLQKPLSLYRCPSDGGPPINTNLNNYANSNYVANRTCLGPSSSNIPTNMTLLGITDGTSNTILVGERDSVRNIGATWVRANQTSASYEGRPGSGLNPLPGPWNTGSNQRLAFSSYHTSGCNFLLGDGSVRLVSNGISADPNDSWANFPINQTNYTLQNVCNPADGNVLGSDW